MNNSERYIYDRLPSDFFDRIGNGDFNHEFYPCFSNRKAWKNAAKSPAAESILKHADSIPENEVPQLLFSNYRKFEINGNRTEYEEPYFERRQNLAYLAAAFCLTGDRKKYMPRILDYVLAILEEHTWCVPAHSVFFGNIPERWRTCDLFSSETGMILTLLRHILGDELEAFYPGIREKIREEVLFRTVYSVQHKKLPHWWDLAEKPANWTVWCSANCILISLLLEQNGRKRAASVKHFLENTSRFITYCADDGYCPEGPMYYMKANLMVFQALYWLHKAVPGSADQLIKEPKLKAMAEFFVNVQIGEYVVSFGDSRPHLYTDFALALTAGKMFRSKCLLNLGALKKYSLGNCGDHLKTCLEWLFDVPSKLPDKFSSGPVQTLFKDRLAILRSGEFSVSVKGGCNGESHNHNDLGHFELFSGSEPVILDAGTGSYSKINFSEKRYTLWNIRGAGHNAPVFGDFEQILGSEYFSSVDVKNGRIFCDLSQAYPKAAGIKQLVRTIDFQKDQVVVEDTAVLKKKLPVTITLLTMSELKVKDPHTIRIGNIMLTSEGISFDSVEEMPELINNAKKADGNVWKKKISAIRLKTEQANYRLIFQPVKRTRKTLK